MSRPYRHQVRGVAETAAWIGYRFLDRMSSVTGNFAWGCAVGMAAPWAQEAEREWKKMERSGRSILPPFVDWLNDFCEKKLAELEETLAREAREREEREAREARARAMTNPESSESSESSENAENAERRQDGQEGGV